MLAEIKDNPPGSRSPVCTIATLYTRIEASEADALTQMLADERWTGADIARAITKECGIPVQGTTLRRHRKGECDCGRGNA